MIISQDDAKELKQRAQRRHDDAARGIMIEIMAGCTSGVFRLVSNRVKAHRYCPARACTRAHRCTSQSFRCSDIVRRLKPDLDEYDLIDKLYWRVLERLVKEDADTERGEA